VFSEFWFFSNVPVASPPTAIQLRVSACDEKLLTSVGQHTSKKKQKKLLFAF
jgi:hypothetical protein